MKDRNSSIMAALAIHRNSVVVSKMFGLTDVRIRQIARENNFTFPRRLPLIERIYEKCKWNGECLEWTGSVDQHGYGGIRLLHKTFRVTRVVLEIALGVEFPEMDVLHRCDNPRCVNTDHLFLGTAKDNALDMVKKGRSGGAKIGPDLALQIRNRALGTRRMDRAIAQEFGVSRDMVRRIRVGSSWAI